MVTVVRVAVFVRELVRSAMRGRRLLGQLVPAPLAAEDVRDHEARAARRLEVAVVRHGQLRGHGLGGTPARPGERHGQRCAAERGWGERERQGSSTVSPVSLSLRARSEQNTDQIRAKSRMIPRCFLNSFTRMLVRLEPTKDLSEVFPHTF